MVLMSRLHYIPLSTSYAEVYNIHAFFSGGTPDALAVANSTVQHSPRRQRTPLEGDMRLRRIARAGKHWKNTIGRQVDMEGEPSHIYSTMLALTSFRLPHSLCFSIMLRICSTRSGQPGYHGLYILMQAKRCVGSVSYRILSYTVVEYTRGTIITHLS